MQNIPSRLQGIYGIFDGDVCCYVGQSVQIGIRARHQHLRALKVNNHWNPRLQRKFNNGVKLTFKVLEGVEDRTKLTEREIFWYKELEPTCNIVEPKDECYMSSGRRGKPAWNSGKTKLTDERLAEIGKKISEAKKGRPNGTKGLGGGYRKGTTKETNSSVLKQSISLKNRPLVPCEHCGKEVKVLKRHYHYCSVLKEQKASAQKEVI